MSPLLCAELAAIRPVTLATVCDEYAANVHAMTDEQLAREVARVEALPGTLFRRIANEAADARRTATTGGDPMKQRLFIFSGGSTARVTCKHCGWASQGRGDAQKVFDRSIGHECAGVESYAAMLARHAAEQVAR